MHQWRTFLFSDPGLPRELLPQAWPGDRAARLFAAAERLRPAADRFVGLCLAVPGRARLPVLKAGPQGRSSAACAAGVAA